MKRTLRVLCLLPLCVGAFAHSHAAAGGLNVVGTTIAETQKAIREGRITCRGVVEQYLARIRAYDQTPIDGLRLNAIVLVNPARLNRLKSPGPMTVLRPRLPSRLKQVSGDAPAGVGIDRGQA